jgi:signal transduction histidine kinase
LSPGSTWRVWPPLALALVYGLLAMLSVTLSRQPGQIANVWYANAAATAMLTLRPRRAWPPLLLAVALANALANGWWGDSWLLALAFVPSNLFEVVLGAALLQRAGMRAAGLNAVPALLSLLLLGGVLPQLAAASLAALTFVALGLGTALPLWVSWFESSVIGAASALVLAVLLLDQPRAQTLATLRDRRLWGLLSLTLAITLLCLARLPFPFVYIGVPLMAAALLLDLLAVALLAWLVSLTVAVSLVTGMFVPPPVTADWQHALVYLACTAALVPPQLLAASLGALRDSHARLLERKAELRRANEGLQQFVRIASHDLREPLNTIDQFSSLVLLDHADRLPPDALRWLRLVQGEAQRMRTLLDDVLQYAQVRQDALPTPQPVALDEVLRQALQGLAARLHASGGQVQVAAPLPVVLGHVSLLALVLQNLLGNALKFQPAGQQPQVSVSASVADGWVALVVADNGIGIAPADRAKLFRPFQRLHRRAEFSGTGLGLALCQQIAQAHGGEITVTSQPGQGSRFTLRLPAG